MEPVRLVTAAQPVPQTQRARQPLHPPPQEGLARRSQPHTATLDARSPASLLGCDSTAQHSSRAGRGFLRPWSSLDGPRRRRAAIRGGGLRAADTVIPKGTCQGTVYLKELQDTNNSDKTASHDLKQFTSCLW